MDKNKIQKIYKKKIKEINFYNKFYYENNDPKIDDSKYDKLKNEILSLEKKSSTFVNCDTPILE